MSDETVVVRPERPKRTGLLYGLLALIAIVAIGAWLWIGSRPTRAESVRRDIVGAIRLPGEILVPPSARGDVRPPFDAPVDKVVSSVGSHVSRGDALVTLSAPNIENYTDAARKHLQEAETAYANAQKTYGAGVENARRSFAAAQQANQAVVTEPGGATVVTAPDPGAVAAAQDSMRVAEANYAAQMEPFRQQLEAARDAYQQARAGERGLTLRAPITGTVLALTATPGNTVGPKDEQPVATVVNLAAIQVQAAATPEQAAHLKPEMEVQLSFAELPDQTFKGSVSNITTRVDEKMAGLVKEQKAVVLIDFANVDAVVKPGMKPTVAVVLDKVEDAVAVPAQAVEYDSEQGARVEVLRDRQWQKVDVKVGVTDGVYTEIKSGLKAGEVVRVPQNPIDAAGKAIAK